MGRSPGGRHPGNKRPMDFGLEGQQADKRHKSANEGATANGQVGGLASLMQYGSDDDGNEEAERPDGASADPGMSCCCVASVMSLSVNHILQIRSWRVLPHIQGKQVS